MNTKKKYPLYGAILGDIVGRKYEYHYEGEMPDVIDLHPEDGKISDDSIMTLAAADYILFDNMRTKGTLEPDAYLRMTASDKYKWWYKRYPDEEYGYGDMFTKWCRGEIEDNDSWGNGCIMRVSPFMWTNDLFGAIKQAESSHGANESAVAITMLYALYRDSLPMEVLDAPTKFTKFDVSALGTMEFVDKAFNHYITTHETIIKTVRCGGDTDTNASIATELMNYHLNDLTEEDIQYVRSRLDDVQLKVLDDFNNLINK